MKGPGATQRWLLTYLENVRYDERPLYTRAFCSDLLPPGAPAEALFARPRPDAPPLTSEEEAAILDFAAPILESLRDSEDVTPSEDVEALNFWVPLSRAIRARHGDNPTRSQMEGMRSAARTLHARGLICHVTCGATPEIVADYELPQGTRHVTWVRADPTEELLEYGMYLVDLLGNASRHDHDPWGWINLVMTRRLNAEHDAALRQRGL